MLILEFPGGQQHHDREFQGNHWENNLILHYTTNEPILPGQPFVDPCFHAQLEAMMQHEAAG